MGHHQSIAEELRQEIEAVANQLGLSPSTVGERAGQGGHFYRRCKEGKRVWPETAESVREKLTQMASPSATPPATEEIKQ